MLLRTKLFGALSSAQGVVGPAVTEADLGVDVGRERDFGETASTCLPAPWVSSSGVDSPPDDAKARPLATPSFEEIYEMHFDFVWRLARRLGAGPNVDDVVQDVFLTVYRRLPTFDGRSSLRTWLFGITRRVVATNRRGGARRRQGYARVRETEDLDAAPPDPEKVLERRESSRILQEILDGLDDGAREVFVLVDLEHIPIVEVASGLGINIHTARWRLKAARRTVERALERFQARQRSEAR